MNNIKMIYYDRINVSEGIVLIRQANQEDAIFVIIGIFRYRV